MRYHRLLSESAMPLLKKVFPMFKSLVRKIFPASARRPLIAKVETYQPPCFTDTDRLVKIQKCFPAIDAIYQAYAEQNHFPGYAFGIMVDSKLVHSGSGGYADIDKKIPASTTAQFRIASMTKSFTAMAILMLRDAGKLNLDDPVERYIPEMKNQQLTHDAPVITIRNLLIHSAGFPQDDPWGDRKLQETDEALLMFLRQGISFSNEAGTQYEYSNLAYALLGYIIKKISGMSYEQFIANAIWQPLGMKQVAMEYTKVPAAELVQGYRRIDETFREEALLHDGTFGAMGGMITSIESFSQYVALHQAAWPARDDVDRGPLKRSSLREMHQPSCFVGNQGVTTKAYGYGLSWSRDDYARVFVGHSGGLPGFGSNWLIMPEQGVGVIFFANVTYANAEKVNQDVLAALIQSAELKPRQLPLSSILKARKAALIKFLPGWKQASSSGIFASNFFLDNSEEMLRKESADIFAKAGKIIRVGEMVPENQLRGHFIMEGEKASIRVSFTLTPENPALIQKCFIKLVE
jgi:CubicO group peptidase (beta-lactamase class C family)